MTALHDPERVLDLIDETRTSRKRQSRRRRRRFLLRRSGSPVDVLHGEEPLGEAEDWGYGPPRVRLGAEALGHMGYDQLIANVDLHELVTAAAYPSGWDTAESLNWARDWYTGLARFLSAAAHEEQAVIVRLD